MKYKIGLLLFVFFTAVYFTACVKDNFDFDKWDKEINYEGSFAFPAVYGDVALSKIVKMFDEDGFLAINDQGFISVYYRTTVKSNDVHDIIFLPNQSVSADIQGLDFDFSGFNSSGDVVSYQYQTIMEFDVFNDDAELEKIILKSGLLNLSATSTFQHAARINLSFPGITKNGEAYVHVLNFMPGGETINNNNLDFTGYEINLAQTPQGFNEIYVDVDAELFYSGSSDNSGTLSLDVDMVDMQYNLVEGYFGINTLIFESDTIDITIFKNEDEFSLESYRFVDPKFKVDYKNSYGIPSSFYFSMLKLKSALDDLEYDIIHYGGGLPMDSLNPYNITYAENIGDVVEDHLLVDRNNSNIDEILEKRPKWIQFVAHAHTNPSGVVQSNFVTDESYLEADVMLELPLWGYVHNFHIFDTTEFEVELEDGEFNPITRALVRIDIQNGLPVEAYGQIYFIDENDNILDSLFYSNQERIINAASVDNDGRVIDFSRKITKIEIDRNRLEKIENTTHLVYGAYASTTNAANQEVVKIYDDYRVIFDIGFEVDIDATIDLDTIN